MEEVARSSSLTVIRVDVKIQNTSKSRVYILSSWYNILGSQITRSPNVSDNTYIVNAANRLSSPADSQKTLSDPRFSCVTGEQVVYSGQLLEDHWSFDVAESTDRNFLVYVPNDLYDQIDGIFNLYFSRSTGPFAPPQWDFTLDRQLNSKIILKSGAVLDLRGNPSQDKVAQDAGVGFTDDTYELSMWPAARPAGPATGGGAVSAGQAVADAKSLVPCPATAPTTGKAAS